MTESWRIDINTTAIGTPASSIATAENATQVASTLKSSWIRRFMPQPSTDPDEQHDHGDSSRSSLASDQGTSQGFDQMGGSAIRRSRSCSSLFRDADYFPRRSKRTQEAQALEYELGLLCEENSVGYAFSPKKSRTNACAHSLSVSLDRRSFLPTCRAFRAGAMPCEEETLERLKLHSSDNPEEWAMSSLFKGPLPYSNLRKFQGQQQSEMKLETTKDSVSITGICSKDEPKGFAALLTPIPSPACLSRRYETCEEASSTTNLLNKDTSNYRPQQHENSSSSKATHSAFWNDSTPSESRDFVLSRPQPPNKPGGSLLWLNRWSASACDEAVESSTTSMTVFEDSKSKVSSRYVPSATAMAIIGKSSMNMHSSSTASWCNSVASWQAEDCDAKDSASTHKP